MVEFVNSEYKDIFENPQERANEYSEAYPFPSTVFKNFFNPEVLDEVLDEFPNLKSERSIKFDDPIQRKYAGRGEKSFGPKTRAFMRFLNSEPFLEFLQDLTGIEERLIPDPYFFGGGLHEIKKGGLLKVHTDFKRHETLGLDRRINVLVYLNKDWKEEYGGHFELWEANLEKCGKRVLPEFNTLAIFSTTDYSYHGHPNPLTCPEDRSRKSLALYYYSNGRPAEEVDPEKGDYATLFVPRKGHKEDEQAFVDKKKAHRTSMLIRDFVPPIVFKFRDRIRK